MKHVRRTITAITIHKRVCQTEKNGDSYGHCQVPTLGYAFTDRYYAEPKGATTTTPKMVVKNATHTHTARGDSTDWIHELVSGGAR